MVSSRTQGSRRIRATVGLEQHLGELNHGLAVAAHYSFAMASVCKQISLGGFAHSELERHLRILALVGAKWYDRSWTCCHLAAV